MPRKRQNREHQEQRALIEWARLNERIEPRLKLLFAIPNGRKRTKAEAGMLKAEGVKAGVPDLMLPTKGSWNEHGLFIEMKADDGKLSKAQGEFAVMVEGEGYAWNLCTSWVKAATIICEYLGNRKLKPPAAR